MFKIKSQHLWLVVSVLVYFSIGIYGLPHGKTLPLNSLSQDASETFGLLPSSEDRRDAATDSQVDLHYLEGIFNGSEDNNTINNVVSLLDASDNISVTSQLINASLLEEKLNNFEPNEFAELQSFTKAMSMIHDIALFDNKLNMDLFLNKFCSIRAKDIMDKMPFGGTLRVVAQITVYEAEGCELLAQRYAKKLISALGVRQREIKQIMHKSCPYDFNDGVKCENRINDLLHTIPSLGHLYSVVGAAVYGAENMALTQAKVNEVFQEFSQSNISQFYSEFSVSRFKREGCVSEREANIHAVVTWIPVIGTLYNAGSSAVYAANGCMETAKERVVDVAIDLAVDAASIVTFGGVGAAAKVAKAAINVARKINIPGEHESMVNTITPRLSDVTAGKHESMANTTTPRLSDVTVKRQKGIWERLFDSW